MRWYSSQIHNLTQVFTDIMCRWLSVRTILFYRHVTKDWDSMLLLEMTSMSNSAILIKRLDTASSYWICNKNQYQSNNQSFGHSICYSIISKQHHMDIIIILIFWFSTDLRWNLKSTHGFPWSWTFFWLQEQKILL